MITIKNQFTCRITAGEFKDFVLTEDVISLTYMLSAGLAVPYFDMTFILRNQEVLKYLNEGNIINVSMGKDELDMCGMQFRLISDITTENYTLGSNVTIKGVLHRPKFITLAKNAKFDDQSINIIKSIASKHFSVVSNIGRTNDKQEWTQTGISDRQMIRDVWLHSFIDNQSVIACAFENDTFRIKNLKTSITSEAPWRFSANKAPISQGSKIVHFGQFWTTNNYGAINECIGRKLENIFLDVDTGEIEKPESHLKNLTVVGSNKLNVTTTDVKEYKYGYKNSEVNTNYLLAEQHNMRNLMMFGSFKIFIPTAGVFSQFHLLDLAYLEQDSVGERCAGYCFIERILYRIEDRRLMTNITLCKEAPNEIRGSGLAT